MYFRLLSQVLSCLLLAPGVLGGRMKDVAQRKGFTEQMIKRSQSMSTRDDATPSNSSLRFHTNKTAPYYVPSLPDIPQEFMTEMYSGLIPINMNNESRALFFVFQPKVGDPSNDITIWFNGGPGCSSLEGFFQENGLISWQWGQYAPQINPYSWVNVSNVIWVEQPVGTGFSIGEVNATSQEDIAADFADFYANFLDIFDISGFKTYVTGESYAGRYVPYVADELLNRNATTQFNVSGALMYDPCIGSYVYTQQQAVAVPYVQQYNNVMGFNSSFMDSLNESHYSCGYQDYIDQYLVFPANGTQPAKFFNASADAECDLWDAIYFGAYAPNPCFNVYEVGLQCPLLSDPLGFPTDLQYSYPGLPVYFNRTDVKEAMHAPMDVSWGECSGNPFTAGDEGPEMEGDLSADPIQSVLPRVIEATNRVLVANGALDFEIITNGTLIAIQNMTWGGQLGFQNAPSKPINITLPDIVYQDLFTEQFGSDYDNPQGVMGVQHYERGLMWAETYLSGHMQPQFQPRSSYRHLQWLLGQIENL